MKNCKAFSLFIIMALLVVSTLFAAPAKTASTNSTINAKGFAEDAATFSQAIT